MNPRQITRTALTTAAVAAMSLAIPAQASALTPTPDAPFQPDLELGIPQPDPCLLIPELCVPGDDGPDEEDEGICVEADDCLAIPEEEDPDCPEFDDCFANPDGGETPDPETPDPQVLPEVDQNPDAPVRANPNFTG